MKKFIPLFILMFLILGVMPAQAAPVSEYGYRIPVEITMTGDYVGATPELFCIDAGFTVQLKQLGYVRAVDGTLQDVRLDNTGGTDIYKSNDSDCVWFSVSNLADGITETYSMYVSQPTQTRDGYIWVNDAETSGVFTVPDSASRDVTSNLTFQLDQVSLGALGPSGAAASGGVETLAGGYLIHTFNSTGTFTVTAPGIVNYLIVGGGGSGGGVGTANGSGGGGGAGAVLQGTFLITAGTYPAVVGAGGPGGYQARGQNGGASSINAISAIGGGGGAATNPISGFALTGASGGGGSSTAAICAGAAGTGGLGYAGGNGTCWGNSSAGGGGGSGSVGLNFMVPTGGGGTTVVPPDGSITIAGGGGGGFDVGYPGLGQAGGGNGAQHNNGGSATPNTGSGGGGASKTSGPAGFTGGSGGSGLIKIWYEATSCVVCKAGAYGFYVGASGITGSISIAGAETSVTYPTPVVDTPYDLRVTYDGANVELYVDDISIGTAAAVGAVDTNANGITADTDLSISRLAVGNTSVATPTWVADLNMEADNLNQTQAGSAGNAWEFIYDVIDNTGNINNGSWSFTADQTGFSYALDPLQVLTPLPTLLSSQILVNQIGQLPDFLSSNSAVGFPGITSVTNAITTVCAPSCDDSVTDAMWLLLLGLIGLALGAVVVRATGFAGLGVFIAAAWVGIGWPMGLYPMWIAVLGCMALLGMTASMAMVQRK